jgi:hypothetical protein
MVDLLRIILQKGKVTAATIRLGWIAVLPAAKRAEAAKQTGARS